MKEKFAELLNKLKAAKPAIISNFASLIGCAVLSGIVATAAGEQLGYGALAAFLLGRFGQQYLSNLIEKKVK